MPIENRFRHQEYEFQPSGRFQILRPEIPPPPDTIPFRERMAAVGEKLSRARVTRVYLLHGSFVGHDALGFIREIGRIAPRISDRLRRNRKKLIENLTGESGNFTSSYAALLRASLNNGNSPSIAVESFDWSSENHHTGRADGAVRLLNRLLDQGVSADEHVMLWGHSHAGNVFALLTNLLGSDHETKARFFQAARPFVRSHAKSEHGMAWQRAQDWLATQDENPFQLDIVTFGTPVRYGWETRGFSHLLHFVNHRPIENLPVYQAQFPIVWENLSEGTFGDYVQQLGIAGTNLLPNFLNRKNWLTERNFLALLQPEIRKRDFIHRLSKGHRVHHDGTTLLVDYPDDGIRSLRKQVFGHGIYTSREWMLFHCEEIVDRII